MYNKLTDNKEVINDEPFTLQTLLEYIHENVIGLLLLVLAFFIIYIVDYISRINALIFTMPSHIPGLPSSPATVSIPNIKTKGKFKKIKKH
jgi:hypothetical protein